MHRLLPAAIILCLLFIPAKVRGQFLAPADPGEVQLGKSRPVQYRVGVEITASAGACRDIYATMAIPREWPEQTVRIVEQDLSPEVAPIQFRDLTDTVRQMVIQVPALPAGRTAKALITFEVTRSDIVGPPETDKLQVPKKDRDLTIFLNPSPYIESRDSRIRREARDVVKSKETAWEKAEAIYDYVRDKVKYVNGPLKGAKQALRDGEGDCEELTSLFIAMCRVNDIPARVVWIPGHCYPEFYLTDESGKGTWFPCQAAGDRAFGSMSEARPILQKGDNFTTPENPRERVRYVTDYLRGLPLPGGGKPKVRWVRDLSI